jgi:hypothetical protein
MKRKALWIVAITTMHAALTIGAVLTTMGLAMSAFDGKRESGMIDHASSLLTRVLMAPVGPIYQAMTPRKFQGLPLIGDSVVLLNSLLWAIALVWLLERRSRGRAIPRDPAAVGRPS